MYRSHTLVIALLLAIPFSQHAYSQTPALINYQGRLVEGTNLVNGSVGMELRLFDLSGGGSLLYADSNNVAVADGLYSTYIGDGTIAGSLSLALTNAEVWLEVRVNGVALAPRERIVSVPYARVTEGLSLSTNGTVILNPAAQNSAHASALQGVIGGGASNWLDDTWQAVIAGGTGNTVGTFSDASVIAGGRLNTIRPNGLGATIGGGINNVIETNGAYGTIPGGRQNQAAAYGFAAGRRAKSLHQGAFVWGDSSNADIVSTTNDQVTFRASGGFRVLDGPISGDASGLSNFPSVFLQNSATNSGALALTASNTASAINASAAGGSANRATGVGSTVGGGMFNVASGSGATVAGGGGIDPVLLVAVSNRALGDFSFVGGGGNNTASGRYSAVLGGKDNLAGGHASSVLGGISNQTHGLYSVAAGRNARAMDEGVFVWADSQAAAFSSTSSNQFLVRASGGMGLNIESPTATLHIVGSPTLGSVLVAPNEGASGDDSELILSENIEGQYGAKLYFDGGLNQLRIFGIQDYSNRGPHVVIARDSGLVGIGPTTPAAALHVNAGDQTTPVLLVAGATSTVDEADGADVTIQAGRGGPGDIGLGLIGGTGGVVTITGGMGGSGGFGSRGGDVSIVGGAPSGFGVSGNVFIRGGMGLAGGNVLLAVTPTGTVVGAVGIATTNIAAPYALSVGGSIRCEEVVVESGWADFVFADGYALPPLEEVARSIREDKRLPGMPSAADVQAEGIGVGETQTLLLQKIEELTLYMLEQQRKIESLRAEVRDLRGGRTDE